MVSHGIAVAVMTTGLSMLMTGCGGDDGLPAAGNGSPSSPSASSSVSGLRGFYSPIQYWDNTFASASPDDCVAQGAEIHPPDSLLRNITHAWRLSQDVLACVSDPGPRSAGGVDGVDLYFSPDADVQSVLTAVGAITPADSVHDSTLPGVNSPKSKFPHGTCQVEVYTSEAVSAAVLQGDASAASSGDPHQYIVQLQSGTVEPGGFTDRPFDSNAVHVATIQSAGEVDTNAAGQTEC